MTDTELAERKAYFHGGLWMVLSGLIFVLVAILVRWLNDDLPSEQAVFIRYLFALIFLMPTLLKFNWQRLSLSTGRIYLLRGVFHSAAVILWFYAMANIPMSEVTAISYTTPIYTAIGAVLIFGETFRLRRMLAIVVGFIGVLIILRPGFQEIALGSLAQAIAAPCFAISFLFTKHLTKTESIADITVMLTLACTIALAPMALLNWHPPEFRDLALLAGIALLATGGHYSVTRAISLAPLTVTQPMSFIQMIWAVMFGYLLFDETPDVWVISGAVLIVAAISYMAHREMVIARRQAALLAGNKAV